MAHRLQPTDGESYLLPVEVVRRLESEFAFVDADPKSGREHVEGMIQQFERMRAPSELIAEHRQIQDSAIDIAVADATEPGDAYLSFVAMQGQGLFISYCSGEHLSLIHISEPTRPY